MSDRDWDAEMRKIDQQLASIPSQASQPARGQPQGGGTAPQPQGRPETSTFGVMARLGLACVLGVAIYFWPYGARCGIGLAGYLGAVTTLIVAGVWSSIWTWRHRAAKAHMVSLLLLTWGLVLLGFASLYREGFEVVLFLQTYYLQMGGKIVLLGALLGLFFTGIVAVLTFVAHRKLPYRKMLVLTGIMLGFVLLVMVGEQAQEMQLAGWINTTQIDSLAKIIPDWAGLWFSIFPTVQTLLAQALALILVVGSYYASRYYSAKTRGEEIVGNI